MVQRSRYDKMSKFMKKYKRHIVIICIFFLFGVVVFIIGDVVFKQKILPTQIAKSTSSKPAQLRNNIRPFFGEIVNIKDETFTVKNMDGSRAELLLTNETKISGGKKSDLAVGQKISGIGNVESNGSITVKTIQINPKSSLK